MKAWKFHIVAINQPSLILSSCKLPVLTDAYCCSRAADPARGLWWAMFGWLRALGSCSAPLHKCSALISLTESFQLLVKHVSSNFFSLLYLSATKIEKVLHCHGTASASFGLVPAARESWSVNSCLILARLRIIFAVGHTHRSPCQGFREKKGKDPRNFPFDNVLLHRSGISCPLASPSQRPLSSRGQDLEREGGHWFRLYPADVTCRV